MGETVVGSSSEVNTNVFTVAFDTVCPIGTSKSFPEGIYGGIPGSLELENSTDEVTGVRSRTARFDFGLNTFSESGEWMAGTRWTLVIPDEGQLKFIGSYSGEVNNYLIEQTTIDRFLSMLTGLQS